MFRPSKLLFKMFVSSTETVWLSEINTISFVTGGSSGGKRSGAR